MNFENDGSTGFNNLNDWEEVVRQDRYEHGRNIKIAPLWNLIAAVACVVSVIVPLDLSLFAEIVSGVVLPGRCLRNAGCAELSKRNEKLSSESLNVMACALSLLEFPFFVEMAVMLPNYLFMMSARSICSCWINDAPGPLQRSVRSCSRNNVALTAGAGD